MLSFVPVFLFFHSAVALISLQQHNIEPNSLTVSGISAGAAMATQFHVIHSTEVRGAGMFAGVPFDCALGLVAEATNCMQFPGLISVNNLISRTENAASRGEIDDTSNLSTSRIYIFHGTEDTVVRPGSGNNVQEYYQHYTSDVKAVFNIAAQHCYPTDNFGDACDRLNTQHYINNCNYRGAFEMLNYLYGGGLAEPSGGSLAALQEFDQSEYFYISPPSASSMDNVGYVYIPNGCADMSTPCKLHIAFHGCQQGRQEIGDVFARNAGYLEVAEANNIIVLFPQIIKNALVNPQGCFDWWGYTNNFYDTRDGNQVLAVKRMVNRLKNGE